MNVRVLDVAGTPWEIGQRTGEALRDEVRRDLAITLSSDPPASERIGTFVDVLEEDLPDVLEEMRGLADGAGVDPDRIYRANMPTYDDELSVEGCTNVAFADGPDGPVLGKNNDGQPPDGGQEPTCARVIRPEDGSPLVSVHFAASVAVGDGMNAHGVAVGHSSVGSVFQQSDHHVPIRLWSYHALKHSASTAEFVRRMAARPHRGKGYSHLVVDREGTVRSLETPCPLVQVRRPDRPEGMYCVNRYFLDRIADADRRPPEKKADANRRAAFLDDALAAEGTFDADAMWELLRSHGEPASVCRHGGEDVSHTEYSLLMLPRQGRVFVSHGYACERDVEVVRLPG